MAAQRKLILRQCVAPNNELLKGSYMKGEKITLTNFIVKDNCSILEPHFIIKTFEGFIAYNYCYWSDVERDYFITDIITLPQGQIELVCKVDVLYSFRDAIQNLIVHEERATSGQTNLLVDEQVPVMHNTLIKDILPLEMRPLDKFMIEENNQYILTRYSSYHYKTQQEEELEDDGYKGYKWGVLPTAYQNICNGIANRAKKYLDRTIASHYAEVQDAIHGNYKNKIWQYMNCYTQFPANSGYDWYFDSSNSVRYQPSRYDTAYSEESNAISQLRYTPGLTDANIPQAIKDAGVGWNGWDCSMLAWRCAYFGGGLNLCAPNAMTTSQACSPTSVEIACAFLNFQVKKWLHDLPDGSPDRWDYKTAQVIVNNANELLPGDIIIRGNVGDGSPDENKASYWLLATRTVSDGCIDGKKWYYEHTKHLTTERRKADEDLLDDFNVDCMVFINHAMIVESTTSYIDSTGGYIGSKSGYAIGRCPMHKIKPIDAVTVGYNGRLWSENPPFNFCNSTESEDYFMIVLRPALLKYYLDNGYEADVNNPNDLTPYRSRG